MALHDFGCKACGREIERLEVTSEDRANPPQCCGAPMTKLCGAASVCDVTMRGTWVRFRSNRPSNPNDKRPRGI